MTACPDCERLGVLCGRHTEFRGAQGSKVVDEPLHFATFLPDGTHECAECGCPAAGDPPDRWDNREYAHPRPRHEIGSDPTCRFCRAIRAATSTEQRESPE